MARYECSVYGHVYDEEKEGRAWDSLPVSWTCPVCDSAKAGPVYNQLRDLTV
ncbi:MAG: rubredoxin [Planctomycetes bacterium]|nr:rubredoxin [Planctomycetota bacterium]